MVRDEVEDLLSTEYESSTIELLDRYHVVSKFLCVKDGLDVLQRLYPRKVL